MTIRRLYIRQDGKWAWQLVVDGNVVATDGGQGYDSEASARDMASRVLGGEFADAEKKIRRRSAAKQTTARSSVAEAPAQESGPSSLGSRASARKSPRGEGSAARRTESAPRRAATAKRSPGGKASAAKKAPATKPSAAKKKSAQQPGTRASTSGKYQQESGGSEVTVPKGHRLPPGRRKGEQWVNVDPTKNKSGGRPAAKQAPPSKLSVQQPGTRASTSGQYQHKSGGSEVTVSKGHRLPPGRGKGEQWVNVDPAKNKSGRQAVGEDQTSERKTTLTGTTSSPRGRGTSGTGTGASVTSAEVRAWARRNGYAVRNRGRVPAHVSSAYRKAHQR